MESMYCSDLVLLSVKLIKVDMCSEFTVNCILNFLLSNFTKHIPAVLITLYLYLE